MRHRCHALGCLHPCPPEKLMCAAHWAMVPDVLRREVRAHYRRGQCDDKRPSEEWLIAATRARLAVAEREGAPWVDFLRRVVRAREERGRK